MKLQWLFPCAPVHQGTALNGAGPEQSMKTDDPEKNWSIDVNRWPIDNHKKVVVNFIDWSITIMVYWCTLRQFGILHCCTVFEKLFSQLMISSDKAKIDTVK